MTGTEWFEEWFESPLYESLYANRNEAEAARLADFIEELLPCDTFPKLLDLGCGRGRHSLELAGRGYRVTGMDLSEEAVRKARRKAQERGVEGVRFVTGDMRVPLSETFDAVLNLFTSFGYFEEDRENRRVIAGVHSMLRPGGVLFLDYLNAPKVRDTFEAGDKGSFRDIRYTIRRYINDGAINKEITFDSGRLETPKVYTERVKLYDMGWFEEAFDRSGLRLDQVYGGYGGESYDPARSPRLVMVASRPS